MHPLEALLDETHAALLSGDLGRLAVIARQADPGSVPSGLDGPLAARLQQKAQRNSRLLQAALRGLQAARFRLADIATPPTLSTYDARGRKEALPAAPNTLPRRI